MLITALEENRAGEGGRVGTEGIRVWDFIWDDQERPLWQTFGEWHARQRKEHMQRPQRKQQLAWPLPKQQQEGGMNGLGGRRGGRA